MIFIPRVERHFGKKLRFILMTNGPDFVANSRDFITNGGDFQEEGSDFHDELSRLL